MTISAIASRVASGAGAGAGVGAPPAVRPESFAKQFSETRPLKVSSGDRITVAKPSVAFARSSAQGLAAKAVDGVRAAQGQLNAVLKAASQGRSFTPAQLLSFQAKVYDASQRIDLAGHVADKATSGLKQILQTQL